MAANEQHYTLPLPDFDKPVKLLIVVAPYYKDITDQMVTALMLRETQRQRDRLRADDVLIVPTLGDLSSTDMTAGLDQGVPLGEAAAEAVLPKLRARRLSPEAYARKVAALCLDELVSKEKA